MIRVYLDWNVISQIKNGAHSELKKILDTNSNLLLFYSTAHISDIFSSFSNDENQKTIIYEDLDLLSNFTKDNCLSTVLNSKALNIDKTNPREIFEQRVDSEQTFGKFSFDSILEKFKDIGLDSIDDKYISLLEQYVSTLKDIPLDEGFIKVLSDPASAESIESMLPGIKENPTMEGMFTALGKLFDGLNNSSDYAELRKTYQKSLKINPDKAYNWKDPFKEHEKAIKAAFNSNEDEATKILNQQNSKHAPEWFNQIINEYLKLDMSGFKQDKVEVTSRSKKTFKNTTTDAFHAAYSTVCDFYVINDNKSYLKTKAIFEKLKINTQILKPEEFIEYYNTYLNIEQGYPTINLILAYLNNNEPYIIKDEKVITSLHMTSVYFFDFFNKIYQVYDLEDNFSSLFLSKEKPTNGRFTLHEEIDNLIKRLVTYFGMYEEVDEKYTIEELMNQETWSGRTWKLDGFDLALRQRNGFFQLYVELPNNIQ